MACYEKMYFHLFNAITDALREMERQEYDSAAQALIKAQQWGENEYLELTENEGTIQ